MRQRLRKILGVLNPLRAVRYTLFRLGNWRRGRFRKLDYILFTLPASMPPLPIPRGWLQRRLQGAPPLSLLELDRIFERIADDPRPKGVILHLRGLSMSLADLQTLRGSILRLRRRGKQVVCYALDYDNAAYYVASAADKLLLQPGGELMTLGLRQQAVYLRDALDLIGVSLDVVAISPYKSAYDQFASSAMSPEARQQLEWLLDSRYDMLVQGIAEGRSMTPEGVKAMIDGAPHLDQEALAADFVDGVLNEEGLAAYLGVEHLVAWQTASKVLLKKWRKRSDKVVALLPVEGLMMPGESARPPADIPIPIPFIGSVRAGDLTVTRQVRNLMQNKDAAAVILYVDSGGGSAAAAEAMTSALSELAKDRPLVAFMNSAAASGGYYISTPARWIVAQPGTITGSIGVLTAKPVTGALWDKLHTHRVELTRGANAGLFSDSQPFSEAQRARMRQTIERIYRQFINRAAAGRSMTPEAVDAVGGGRVWTGVQAKANGLVDELGDLQAALDKARALANLPSDAPLVIFAEKGRPLAPQLAEQSNPAAALRYLQENLKAISSGSAQLLTPIIVDP